MVIMEKIIKVCIIVAKARLLGECTIQIVDKKAYDIVKKYAGVQAQYKANTGIKYK